MADLRTLERDSIRAFVESCSEHFTGRVLDFGCGKNPYKDIVDAVGGRYYGYDRTDFPAAVQTDPSSVFVNYDLWALVREQEPFDTVLCTQVFQYVPMRTELHYTDTCPCDLCDLLTDLRALYLKEGGVLVLTYPTNWPEVEEADLHRFTKAGMTRLLVDAGFVIERHERRAEITALGEVFALGYGCVARA